MKKLLFILAVLLFLLSFVGNTFASQVEKIGTIGEFSFGKVDWNADMESDLHSLLVDVPAQCNIEVIGHADHFGPKSINIPLSEARGKFVAEKIKKIIPSATVSSRGLIYEKDDQDIDYRMVELLISYEEDDSYQESFGAVNKFLSGIAETQKSILAKVDEFEKNSSFNVIKASLEDVDTAIENLNEGLRKTLDVSQESAKNISDDFKNSLEKVYSLLESTKRSLGDLKTEAGSTNEEQEKIREAIAQFDTLVASVSDNQTSSVHASENANKALNESLTKNRKEINDLKNLVLDNQKKIATDMKYNLYAILIFGIISLILLLVLLGRKNK